MQYLDEDQPIKAIDLKNATFMLAQLGQLVPRHYRKLLEKERIARHGGRANAGTI